jgi:hypothetical protein
MDVLSAALEYAKLGWYVFPVIGKRPDLQHVGAWSNESSTDPEQIVAWFAGRSGVGIGCDLGRSGLVVIDGDHLEVMPEVLRTALDALGTWTHRGQPDRCSWFFTTADAPPQARHPWGEVKAAGGYVVLAPSPHPDQPEPYAWLARPGAPVPLPDQLRAAVAPLAPPGPGRAWEGGTASAQEVLEARQALGRLAHRVAVQQIGNRNHELNRAAYVAGRWAPHCIDPADIRAALMEAAKGCGLVRDDGVRACEGTIESGLRGGMANPQSPLDDGLDGLRAPQPSTADPCPPLDMATGQMYTMDDLWAASPVMAHVHQAALSRNRSPVAVLVGCLVLASTAAGPRYVLPGVVGSVASLNLLAMFSGPSGAGKSSTMKLVRELMPKADAAVHHAGAGTGEGLVQSFLSRQADKQTGEREQIRDSVFLYVDEYVQMEEMSRRSGNTFMSIMRSMAMGEQVDTTNGGHDNLRHLDALAYRVGMVVGIQPLLSGDVLNEDALAAGTPQRFLWVNVRRPHPDVLPEWPGPLDWDVPEVDKKLGALEGLYAQSAKREPFTYPDDVRAYVIAMDRIAEELPAIEQHSILNRLKVAAAIAILHDRWGTITHWDWLAAGVLLMHSMDTRSGARAAVSARAAEVNVAKGISAAKQAAVVEEHLEDARLGRVRAQMLSKMAKAPGTWHTKMMLRPRLNGGGREFMMAALDALVAEGLVVTRPGRKGGEWMVEP